MTTLFAPVEAVNKEADHLVEEFPSILLEKREGPLLSIWLQAGELFINELIQVGLTKISCGVLQQDLVHLHVEDVSFGWRMTLVSLSFFLAFMLLWGWITMYDAYDLHHLVGSAALSFISTNLFSEWYFKRLVKASLLDRPTPENIFTATIMLPCPFNPPSFRQ